MEWFIIFNQGRTWNLKFLWVISGKKTLLKLKSSSPSKVYKTAFLPCSSPHSGCSTACPSPWPENSSQRICCVFQNLLHHGKRGGKISALSSFCSSDWVPEICALLRLFVVTSKALRKQVLFVKSFCDCGFVSLWFILFKLLAQAVAGTVQYSWEADLCRHKAVQQDYRLLYVICSFNFFLWPKDTARISQIWNLWEPHSCRV